MSSLTTVYTTSHRSRERLARVTDAGREHYKWTDRGAQSGYYLVPTSDLPAVLAIKGIRQVQLPLDLKPCIRF